MELTSCDPAGVYNSEILYRFLEILSMDSITQLTCIKVKRRDHLGDISIDGSIILKRILKEV
jgi:hypothetical protein